MRYAILNTFPIADGATNSYLSKLSVYSTINMEYIMNSTKEIMWISPLNDALANDIQ